MKNKKYILWVDRYTYDKGYNEKTMIQCKEYWDLPLYVLTYGIKNISYISFGLMLEPGEGSSLSCLRWLKSYCKLENETIPECVSHSENKIFNKKFNDILNKL